MKIFKGIQKAFWYDSITISGRNREKGMIREEFPGCFGEQPIALSRFFSSSGIFWCNIKKLHFLSKIILLRRKLLGCII